MNFIVQINMEIEVVKNQFPANDIKHLLYELVDESMNNHDHNVKRLNKIGRAHV